MTVTVDEDKCSGCGTCIKECPAVFGADGDERAKVIADPTTCKQEEACRTVAAQCHVGAIKISIEE